MTNFIFKKKQILGKVIKVFRGDFKSLSVRKKVIFILDRILIFLVITFLIYDFCTIMYAIWKDIPYLFNEGICWMNNIPGNNGSSIQYTTQISHSDNGISNTIRSIFIYGSGGYRLYITRGGTPTSRFVITGGAIMIDAGSRILSNIINDPTYLATQADGLRRVLDINGRSTSAVSTRAVQGSQLDQDVARVVQAQEQVQAAQAQAAQAVQPPAVSSQNTGWGNWPGFRNNFIEDVNGSDDPSINTVRPLLDFLKPILEPVQVPYSNELLANQINDVSIILFLMMLIIMLMFTVLLLNILVFIYSDKIKNYFNNKYIKMYVSITKKFIAIEIILTSITLLYFMYIIETGLRFIATHPINLS